MGSINTAGIYHGIDIPDAPVSGAIGIQAFWTGWGSNLVINVQGTGALGEMYHGTKHVNNPAITWHNVSPDHLIGATDPAASLGQDGDIYLKVV